MGVSVRAYAASRKERGLPGGSRYGVQKALRDGRITKEPDGTIDPDEADVEWDRNTDEGKQTTDPRPASYQEARAIKEALSARMARLEYEERLGQLVSAKEVRREAFRRGRMLRDRLMAIPSRLAPQLAAEESAKAVAALLDRELREVLDDVLGKEE